MLSLGGYRMSGNVLPRSFCWVYTKRTWDAKWVIQPWLRPVNLIKAVAPEFFEAEFNYFFGKIKRQNKITFSQYNPLDLVDQYVQVRSLLYGQKKPTPCWTGKICRDRRACRRSSRPAGVQSLRAVGIWKCFDETKIRTARVLDASGDGDVEQRIGWAPDFNERGERGPSILGNREDDPEDENPDDHVYRFGKKEKWTARQVVRYILENFTPAQFDPPDIVGQPEILDKLAGVWRQEGKSPAEMLNHVIDRKFGAGFYVDVVGKGTSDDPERLQCKIFSTFSKSASYGKYEVTRASERLQISVPTRWPWVHLFDEIPIEESTEHVVDTIYVRGARIVQMGSVHYALAEDPQDSDRGFKRGWGTTVEDAYRTGGGGDSEARDRERARDRFHRVFTTHLLEDGWLNDKPLFHSKLDGEVEKKVDLGVWHAHKRLNRSLPLKYGFSYGSFPLDDENASDSEPEFLQPLVMHMDQNNGASHTATFKAGIVERLHETNPDMPSSSSRMCDRETGIEVTSTPRHLWAVNHWAGNPATEHDPELDYKDLYATVAWQTDHHLEITLSNPTLAGDQTRELVIDVPEAEYWVASPGTICDVKDGQFVLIDPKNYVIRNDVEHLRVVACFAAAWWFERRQPASFAVKAMVTFPLGAMVDAIDVAGGSVEPHTCITSVTQRWMGHRMTGMETGYVALDAAGLAQAQQPLARYRRARHASQRHG